MTFRSIAHKEFAVNGRTMIIDASEILPGYIEVMAMYQDGEELATKAVRTETEAKRLYRSMVAQYAPLTGKYAKLAEDLRAALAVGRAAENADREDGGTCNFDSPSLYLPRWNYSLIERAAREAGCSCYEWKLFGSKNIVFTPDSGAQANARSRNAEAMCDELKRRGYDAMMYYQCD